MQNTVKKPKKTFSKLTPAKKRVAIAKDVLTWLAVKKIIPSPGTYLEVYDPKEQYDRYDGRTDISSDLKRVNGYKCEACALGAIFAVACEISPKIRQGGLGISSGAMRGRLEPYFDTEQLYLIESAFERAECYEQDASDFSGSDNPTTRMRQIMKNIIKNDGTFVP